MQERFRLVPEVSLFFVRDGQLLMIRRANTGYQDGNYALPAGHLEEGETAMEGAIREAREEVGVLPHVDDLRFAHILYRKHDDQRVSFFFVVERWDGEPKNMEPDKHDDLQWFFVDQLPENIMHFHRHGIAEWQAGRMYSELGW